MSNIVKMYPLPSPREEMFQVNGLRYIKTSSYYFVSVLHKTGFLPPFDRCMYVRTFAKDFKQAKRDYEIQKDNFDDFIYRQSHLKSKEVKKQLSFDFE